MEEDDKLFEERFKSLPKDIQIALTSVEVADSIKSIGDAHGLKLDQESALFDLTANVLLGSSASSQFVNNLSRTAGIDQKTAFDIAGDINREIFDGVKASLRIIQEHKSPNESNDNSQDLAILEKAGGFTIEDNGAIDTENGVTTNDSNITSADRTKILADVENPARSPEISVQKHQEEVYTEPLVDHLLNAATATPMEKTVQAPIPVNLPTEPPTPAQQTVKPMPATPVSKLPALNTDQKPKGPDMYRELIK